MDKWRPPNGLGQEIQVGSGVVFDGSLARLNLLQTPFVTESTIAEFKPQESVSGLSQLCAL